MADSLWMQLREVSWEKYEASPGAKKVVPKILENLASRKEARAMKASHELWVALCSGGVYPVAEPCVPFLIGIFDISSDNVQEELLDVFIKLSQRPGDDAEPWQKRLYENLVSERVFFEGMCHSRNERVVEKSILVLNQI